VTLQRWSVRRVLEWTGRDFERRGVESSRLSAELLLAHTLRTDRIALIVHPERELSDAELACFRELVKRRRAAEPVAYLVGEREFYGHPFRVDSRVLIPRPETEILVEVALRRTSARYAYGRALDLCTGSGCVAIAFAKARPGWKIFASDISEPALEVARANSLRLGTVHQVALVCGDLFQPFQGFAPFTLITANPPYILECELNHLPATIRDYEPRVALQGGSDGLEVLRRIVAAAGEHLQPGGVLALEVGFDQSASVAEYLEAAGFISVSRHRDYAGHERVVSGLRGS
jgi:release factor glutamine methyltransferase